MYGKKILPAKFEPATPQVLYRLSCGFQRNVAQIFFYTFAYNSLCKANGSMYELVVTNLE